MLLVLSPSLASYRIVGYIYVCTVIEIDMVILYLNNRHRVPEAGVVVGQNAIELGPGPRNVMLIINL